jgi:hypothetical protein
VSRPELEGLGVEDREREDFSRGAWEPILDGHLLSVARQCIADIAADVCILDSPQDTSFVLCERALLCAYLSAAEPNECWRDQAITYLNRAVDELAENKPPWVGLYGGIAGVGWIIEHVSCVLAEEETALNVGASGPSVEEAEDEDDALDTIDHYLLQQIERVQRFDCYDLIGGLVGIGAYFLERLPRPAAIRGVQRVVGLLEEQFELSWPGTTWHTPPQLLPDHQRELCPNGYYNLGVAHGVPGVIQFLGEVATAQVPGISVSHLLESSVKWLLARQRAPEEISRYASWFVPGQPEIDSRLGWCYGDLGIGAIFYLVGVRRGEPNWQLAGEELLSRCIAWPTDKAHIVDAPLCHGAMGVAHIHDRVYQSSRDSKHREAAIAWYERGLAMRKSGSGVGGFFAYKLDEPDCLYPDPSFLSGAIGVALTLLSAIYPIEPQWDRLMLLSGRNWKTDVVFSDHSV